MPEIRAITTLKRTRTEIAASTELYEKQGVQGGRIRHARRHAREPDRRIAEV